MYYQTIKFVLQKNHQNTPTKNGETGMNSGIQKDQLIRSL